jgi:kinesin family protein 3/17
MNETFTSTKEEVEDKRARREKLAKKLKNLETKKQEIIEKHRSAREELEAEQREIQKQAKLFQLIIENFVPIDERDRLLKRVQFDETQNCWTLKELSKQT